MHGAAYGSFPTVVQLLADYGADIEVWSQPNEQGRTPLFIAEGRVPRRPAATVPPDHPGDHHAHGRRRRSDGRPAAGADRHVLSRPVPEPAPVKPEAPEKSEQSAKAKPQAR